MTDQINPAIITAAIAAASALGGAIVGAVAKGYSSRQRLKELQFEYEKRLQEGYLENARAYTNAIYVPLSICIATLSFAYQSLRVEQSDISKAREEFKKKIDDFLFTIKQFSSQGANAFLTTELDESLQSFYSFLHNSLTADQPTVKMTIKFGSINYITRAFLPRWRSPVISTQLYGKTARRVGKARIAFDILAGIDLLYEEENILSAPLESKEFEERFVRDLHILNVLVKEVTLGPKARHKPPDTR